MISDQDSVKARQAGPGDSAGSGRRTQEVCGGGGEQWKFPRAAHLSKTADVITVIESPLITRRLLL